MTRWWPLAIVLSLGTAVAAEQQPIFRSAADLVTVDVAVRNGNAPVASLGKTDFELRDNTVLQTIDRVAYDVLPIDVRLLVDLSGSITPDQLARYEVAIQQLGRTLSPDDRCEVSTFARRVSQTVALRPPPLAASFARPELDGTSFYDAALLAMMTVAEPGRRQLTLLLTDGVDTVSFFNGPPLVDAAKRTDAVVNVVTAVDRSLPTALEQRLKGVAAPTGGQLITIQRGADIGPALTKMIGDFKRSYVITYTPANVARDGWHAIAVTVPKDKSYTIRARQGYFGG